MSNLYSFKFTQQLPPNGHLPAIFYKTVPKENLERATKEYTRFAEGLGFKVNCYPVSP